jgi:hypothetical protein
MTTIAFRPHTLADSIHIGENMRACDRLELALLGQDNPVAAIYRSAYISTYCEVIDVDGVPAVAFGVAPSAKAGQGVPWLLATDRATPVAKRLVRSCHAKVQAMHQRYPHLRNIVHADNAVSINWLHWLGFTIGDVPCGPQAKFLMFWR